MIIKNGFSRRHFVQSAGAVVLGASFSPCRCLFGQGQVTSKVFKPCVDVGSISEIINRASPTETLPEAPVRTSASDPLLDVDIALIEHNSGIKDLQENLGGTKEAVRRAIDNGAKAAAARGLSAQAPARLAVASRWETSELKVYFYGQNTSLQKAVLKILEEGWSAHVTMDFKQTQNRRDANIRVAFSNTGHWSFVGIDNNQTTGQTMNLQISRIPSKGEYEYGVVLHEFGHAIGCIHEHQSSEAGGLFNEQAVLNYFASQYGWDARKTRLNVLDRYDRSDLIRASAFDGSSIMLYAYPPELTRDGKGTKQNNELSETDKDFGGKLYPPRRSASEPTEDKKPRPEPVTRKLVIGQRLAGAITPSAPVNKYEFEITKTGHYRILTDGYTQIAVTVPLNDEKNLPFKTYDLVNLTATAELPKGRYQLEVRHRYAGGVGEYGVLIREGKQ